MKISACTYITNPLSTGYLIYLPAIQSFLDFADEVIVVDGWSDDGSLQALQQLRGQERLKIIASEQTYWGRDDRWERPQFAVQRQTAFEAAEGDWTIHFDADHVLPDFEYDTLRQRLHESKGRGILHAFNLVACAGGGYQKIKKRKHWCINKRLAREKGISIGYGIKKHTGGNERPVSLDSKESFVDPVTKVLKFYYAGKAYPDSKPLGVSLYKYDHFFFTTQQLLAKFQRFENMRARWEGRPARRLAPDERPYNLIEPDEFLGSGRHPGAFAEFLRNFAAGKPADELDIAGLRHYPHEAPLLHRIKCKMLSG